MEELSNLFQKTWIHVGNIWSIYKKRVDRLLESGAIHDFYVVFGEAMIDMKRALVLVRSVPSVSISDLSIVFARHPGIFRILFLVNGDFLLVAMYPEIDGFQKLESFIQSLEGIKDVKFYPIYRSENCTLKGRKVILTEIQRKVLSCLAIDARMPACKIGKQLSISTRRIESVIEELQKNRNVLFSVRWRPNLGRGLSFMLRITYEKAMIGILPFNQSIAEMLPSDFWYSYLPENAPEMFSVFLVDHISDVSRITELVRGMEYVESVETLIYYSAMVIDPPTRTMLIDVLQRDGVLADYPPRISLNKDLVV